MDRTTYLICKELRINEDKVKRLYKLCGKRHAKTKAAITILSIATGIAWHDICLLTRKVRELEEKIKIEGE